MMARCVSSASRGRDADEFRTDFRSIRILQKIRVLQKPLGRRATERAASSPNRTEPDHESAVVARQGNPLRPPPLPHYFFFLCFCPLCFAVPPRGGPRDEPSPGP